MLITMLSDACRRHASSSKTPTQPTNTDSNKPIFELIIENDWSYPTNARSHLNTSSNEEFYEFVLQTEIQMLLRLFLKEFHRISFIEIAILFILIIFVDCFVA